ncbi:hypothetical protein ECZU08_24880 [Escherichia coli]|nr:hypothetical protein ECZU08_24880 [Escherichia coli]
MSELIATAASSINAFTLAKRVAAFNVPVLIQGETGAGKECVAKYIHTVAFGENDNAPYIGVNCAAIPENMLEATLFGYDKGAFTGAIASVPGKMELANNGTLLLDEIGDMPLALQAKILRVLQEQQVERLGSNRQIKLNFRLIACTNKNLEQDVAAGRFREDLYYRLAVIPITMPPLRERLNDIIPLAESFIKKYATVLVKNITLSESTRRALLNYRWPGNVRQLENAIQRGMILNRDGVIYPDALGLPETDIADHSELQWPVQPAVHIAETRDLGQHGRSAQYQYIADLMRKYQGNRSKIADLLGITRAHCAIGWPPCASKVSKFSPDPEVKNEHYHNQQHHAGANHAGRAADAGQRPAPVLPSMTFSSTDPDVSFNRIMYGALGHVDQFQQVAEQQQTAVDTGKSDDLAGAMIASQQASLSFSALVQVRNKIATGFNDLMSMSI